MTNIHRISLGTLCYFFTALSSHGSETRASRFDLYSEAIYLSRQDVVASSQQLRYSTPLTWQFVEPFMQAGNNYFSLPSEPSRADGGSHTYIGLGTKFAYGLFAFYPELRFRYPTGHHAATLGHGQSRIQREGRGLLIGSYFAEGSLPNTSFAALRQFGEVYSETLLNNQPEDNLIHASFARWGLRTGLASGLSGDVFLEPFYTLDAVKHYYNNLLELRSNARLLWTGRSLVMSLNYSRLYTSYLPVQSPEANPYKDKHWGHRFLLVVGGTFS